MKSKIVDVGIKECLVEARFVVVDLVRIRFEPKKMKRIRFESKRFGNAHLYLLVVMPRSFFVLA